MKLDQPNNCRGYLTCPSCSMEFYDPFILETTSTQAVSCISLKTTSRLFLGHHFKEVLLQKYKNNLKDKTEQRFPGCHYSSQNVYAVDIPKFFQVNYSRFSSRAVRYFSVYLESLQLIVRIKNIYPCLSRNQGSKKQVREFFRLPLLRLIV